MTAALVAAKLALGPVLLPQARWLRRTALRLPEAPGPRDGVEGKGETKLRVLVVGDSSAAGVGMADQAQALALPLAKELALREGYAVGWQLVAQSGVNASEAIALVRASRVEPADVAVIVLGVNDVTSQTTAAGFVERIAALWSLLEEDVGVKWGVVSGLPPMGRLTALPQPLRWYLGRYASWLDKALGEWATSRGVGYWPANIPTEPGVLAEDGFHPGPAVYPMWSARLADIILQGRAKWAAR
ncbi:SGNH/GDSL hydrolase family protein [Ramlibacter sp. PS4R-6]|uniref:SGNH/GDSL hydrolase family protein n=1 Tax=Ramlibacter sp. PS4R-6 TaxID=3133438 RepID=UPI0030A38BD0